MVCQLLLVVFSEKKKITGHPGFLDEKGLFIYSSSFNNPYSRTRGEGSRVGELGGRMRECWMGSERECVREWRVRGDGERKEE